MWDDIYIISYLSLHFMSNNCIVKNVSEFTYMDVE